MNDIFCVHCNNFNKELLELCKNCGKTVCSRCDIRHIRECSGLRDKEGLASKHSLTPEQQKAMEWITLKINDCNKKIAELVEEVQLLKISVRKAREGK